MTYAVQHSPDLERVLSLPRRDWRLGIGGRYGTAEQLVRALSVRLARPGSVGKASLRACQAVALAECADFGGLFAPLQVGAGKTLITLLLPGVIGARRPLLLVRARHREKTLAAWDEYAEHWRLPGIRAQCGTRDAVDSVRRVISGGQTGADRAGLDAAIQLGIPHGGWYPRGRLAEDGAIPEHYELTEAGGYRDRTMRNVVSSDATLIIARRPLSPGSALTERFALSQGCPVLVSDDPAEVAAWLERVRPAVLNVAGPRESRSPGTHALALDLLLRVLRKPLATIEIESYERVSRDPRLLEDIDPDAVICDEAHALANPRAAVTKRVRRFLESRAKRGEPAVFAALSGTLTRRSIRDYAHLARWALGDLAPVPSRWGPLQEWASYLDEGSEAVYRPQPGALARLVPPEDRTALLADPLTTVRRAYGARLEATPGVVSVRGRGCDASLEVVLVRHEVADPALTEALENLRSKWKLPDGREIWDSLEYARRVRELSCGFFYRWVSDPPAAWLDARRAWRQFVARAAERGYDAESQVASACARGVLHSGGAYEEWRKLRPTHELVTEAVWVSDEVVRALVERVEGGDRPAIVWAGPIAAVEKIAEVSGWPSFGAGRGHELEAHVRGTRTHAVASIQACGEGYNLQARALSVVLGWPRAGKTAEQLIGRTHRDPTEHDQVTVEAFCATPEAENDLQLSYQDALYICDTMSSQKFVFADKVGWRPLDDREKQA